MRTVLRKLPEPVKKILRFILAPVFYVRRKMEYLKAKRNPKWITDRFYHSCFGVNINYDSPQNINEKIHWLKFYSDTSMWPTFADKYRVRDYVTGKLGDGCRVLNELYAVWHRVGDIDISKLPNSFVMKMNNGCGDVLIVPDKTKITNNEVIKHFAKIFDMKYGIFVGEYHYQYIKPCVIAEKLLINERNPLESPIDYKFYCSNGKVKYIHVCTQRSTAGYTAYVYDTNWEHHNVCIDDSKHKIGLDSIKAPVSLNEMVELCKKISDGIPFVRIDFYEINDKPIFGEMTMTPTAGSISYYTPEFLNVLGDFVELPKKTMNKHCR